MPQCSMLEHLARHRHARLPWVDFTAIFTEVPCVAAFRVAPLSGILPQNLAAVRHSWSSNLCCTPNHPVNEKAAGTYVMCPP